MIVGAVLFAAIEFITMLWESLSPKQKTQLTAASMGGATGLLVGYGIWVYQALTPIWRAVNVNQVIGCIQ